MDTMDTSDQTRYVALDLHKHYSVMAAVNRDGEVLLPPRRVENDRLPAWAQKHLLPTDMVVIEATTNAYHVYDMLPPLVAGVKVAHARKVHQIKDADFCLLISIILVIRSIGCLRSGTDSSPARMPCNMPVGRPKTHREMGKEAFPKRSCESRSPNLTAAGHR